MFNADRIEDFKKAWDNYTSDEHLSYASYSITILDSKTGSILFQSGKDLGLPPASSMKTITAAAAIHYLGENFTYQTSLKYSGEIDRTTGFLDGYIYIIGSGDPSLGSDRYDQTTLAETILNKWIEAIQQAGIVKCRGIIADPTIWETTKTILTDGWTWNDIGHWYGTGHSGLNWRENEFIIEIEPGSVIDSPAKIKNILHPPPKLDIINELITSANESDPTLYYSLDGSNQGYLRGSVSINESKVHLFHCSISDSGLYIANELTQTLRYHHIDVIEEPKTGTNKKEKLTLLNVHQSPPLSRLIQPFLRISINMYGEVFLKTIAYQTKLSSLTDASLNILPIFIKTLLNNRTDSLSGVATTDGSGLSRSNRLSTFALSRILFTLQKESWFENIFYEALPIINGIKMKSGTLLNTIAYAGYIPNNNFVFSFMINNYFGETAPEMRKKVWKMFDTLK